MDSVEGGSFIFGRYFLAPEALTRAPKVRASRGVWRHAPLQISCILASFLRWDAFSLPVNVSSLESNFHSKKILKCSEMSVCI